MKFDTSFFWIDVVNDDSVVPQFNNKIIAKVRECIYLWDIIYLSFIDAVRCIVIAQIDVLFF